MERQIKGIWIPIEIWENKELTWNEKILFLDIDSFTSKNMDCFISNEYISKLLGVNETSANRILSSLIKKGYIIKTKFDGRKRYVKSALHYITNKEEKNATNNIKYKDQLKDKRWKKLANKIRKRDKYTCQTCGSHKKLQVHHKHYIAGKMAWEYNDSDLITLCKNCHKKIHNIK